MSTTETVTDILSGVYDDDLETLTEGIKARKDILAKAKFLTVKIGATGTLVNLRPKYLVGAPVTVVSRKQTRLEVEIDDGFNRGRYPKKVTVTPDMIELN